MGDWFDGLTEEEKKGKVNRIADIMKKNYFDYTGSRLVAHPSQQVQGYHNYLLNFVEEFEKLPPFSLTSFSYCHNYSRQADESGLFPDQYAKVLQKFPVYCKEDVELLANRLKSLLMHGHGTKVFNRFMQSPIRPGKKLLEHAHKVITNEPIFSLISFNFN